MPRFSVHVPHELGQQQAVERLEGFLAKVKARYQEQVSDLEESWQDNLLKFAFTTYGFRINGDVKVEDQDVKLDGDLPFAAMMFKGRIEQTIRDELTKLLS